MKPIAWFCTKDADGNPLLEKFWATNPRYVEVHSRCGWTPVYEIPADQVLVPRELLERAEESLRSEIEERYAGTKYHPAIRPKYLRDIAEADELRTLLHP